MPFEPGTTLGPYAITAKIGAGGMGGVYRARDTKLDWDVASLTSLNHPNIGGIHGSEEPEGIHLNT